MTDVAQKPLRSLHEKERQPYSSFQALNVQPEQTTDLKLSGGRKVPYVYSLGVNSTIPYIRLIGGASSQKLFSWNEEIVVPPGQMVTVANASYHPGDIFMQSGVDPSAKAGRVTIPVTLQLVTVPGEDDYFEPVFPVDTRRARRAFVTGFANVANVLPLYSFYAIGISKNRSHTNDPALSFEGGQPRARYTNLIEIPPFTQPGLLPLGDRALPTDTVHTLLDVATFNYYDLQTQSQSGAFHYVLEYL